MGLRILTSQRQTSWIRYKRGRWFDLGTTEKKSSQRSGSDLNSGFNHSATLPPPISLACSRPFALLCISRRSPPGLRCINARKRLKSEILDLNPKGDHICLICRVALLTLIFVVVVVFLITEGVISIKQVNDFILFCCYQVSQIQVGKPFMTQLHLM